MYNLAKEKLDRTTNAAEGWHSRLQHKINVHHASIWKFLEFLKQDQRENEILIAQLSAGHTRIKYPVNRKYAG